MLYYLSLFYILQLLNTIKPLFFTKVDAMLMSLNLFLGIDDVIVMLVNKNLPLSVAVVS